MLRTMLAPAVLILHSFSIFDVVKATAVEDCSDGYIICDHGCWDQEDEACHADLSEMQCAEIYGHVEWSQKCNCRCLKRICDYGCWDQEDEACHADLSEMQCAEIYGHVEWAEKCSCRMS